MSNVSCVWVLNIQQKQNKAKVLHTVLFFCFVLLINKSKCGSSFHSVFGKLFTALHPNLFNYTYNCKARGYIQICFGWGSADQTSKSLPIFHGYFGWKRYPSQEILVLYIPIFLWFSVIVSGIWNGNIRNFWTGGENNFWRKWDGTTFRNFLRNSDPVEWHIPVGYTVKYMGISPSPSPQKLLTWKSYTQAIMK